MKREQGKRVRRVKGRERLSDQMVGLNMERQLGDEQCQPWAGEV